VVVDSHESAKALLDRGQLTKRVTIIPLNQVCYRCSLELLALCSPLLSALYLSCGLCCLAAVAGCVLMQHDVLRCVLLTL
jgi:hypothetical protein